MRDHSCRSSHHLPPPSCLYCVQNCRPDSDWSDYNTSTTLLYVVAQTIIVVLCSRLAWPGLETREYRVSAMFHLSLAATADNLTVFTAATL